MGVEETEDRIINKVTRQKDYTIFWFNNYVFLHIINTTSGGRLRKLCGLSINLVDDLFYYELVKHRLITSMSTVD